MWIWTPAVPAGCGPSNSSTRTGAPRLRASGEPARTQRNVSPGVSLDTAPSPTSKALRRPESDRTTSGSAASGFVSVAVTKMALGAESGAGTRLNGRVRKATQSPVATRTSRTSCARQFAGSAAGVATGSSSSSSGAPSRSPSESSITIESRRCLGPRWTAVTRPAPGEVCRTPGRDASSQRSCPRRTRSPSFTRTRALSPWKSSATNATREAGGPSSTACSGSPAMGTSSPLRTLCNAMGRKR
jgi:hypothetical protein